MLDSTAAPGHWRTRALRAVLFDLDGTLLDTADDIALALNRTLGEQGWPPVPAATVRQMIGRGSPILIKRAAQLLGQKPDPALHALMVERFFHHYGALEESGDCKAQPYDGAAATLRELHGAGLAIAVVTNKYQRFATQLLQLRGLDGWVDLVVGGDTCERRKPDPMPLLHACAALGVTPEAVVMVGDSTNDVQAARSAGIPVICVPYGYNEGQDPRSLPCDQLIERLTDLPEMLLGR